MRSRCRASTPSRPRSIGRHAESIEGLRKDVMQLRDTFNELVREQKILGFDENSGLRGNLREAGNAVERIINENMTWLAETDAGKLMMALLIMRHYEAEYRLNPSELTKQQFLAGYKKFTDTFALIDGTPEMKDSLEHEVKTYADTFAQWIDGYRPRESAARGDRYRQPEHAAARRRNHRAGARDRGRSIVGAHRIASAYAHRNYRGRHRHGRVRPWLQLADRAQHHAPAQWPGRRDAAARRTATPTPAFPPPTRTTKSARWREP